MSRGARSLICAFLCAVVSTLCFGQSPIDLKLPFPYDETWTMTRGYNQATHSAYASTDERFALDFAQACETTYGKPMLAAQSGTVALGDPDAGWGNNVWIYHEGGCRTRYAHMSQVYVQAGDFVYQGQTIGLVGNTGNVTSQYCTGAESGAHIHFVLQCLENGQYVGKKPEPMSGYASFANGGRHKSNNGGIVGYYNNGWHNDGTSLAFETAYAYVRNFTHPLGVPKEDSGNPQGPYVHPWADLLVQNFENDDFEKRGVILMKPGSDKAFIVRFSELKFA